MKMKMHKKYENKKWATPTNLKREEKNKQPQEEREIYFPYGIYGHLSGRLLIVCTSVCEGVGNFNFEMWVL